MNDKKKQGWAKLCRDCDLVPRVRLSTTTFTATDADLIFARVKPKGGRRIDYAGCVAALELVAKKRGCTLLEIAHRVIAAGGPAVAEGCAVAEAVRLHDDKGMYTGVYARGGPTTVDADPSSLAAVCDRTAADVRGVSASMGVAAAAGAGLLVAPASAAAAAGSSKRLRAASAASAPAASSRKSLVVPSAAGGGSKREIFK
jgi:hypothetical protein